MVSQIFHATRVMRSLRLQELLDWILTSTNGHHTDARRHQQTQKMPAAQVIRLIRSHEREIIEAFRKAPNAHTAAHHVFLQACVVGSMPLVELLLPICGVDFIDANNETPLMRAALGAQLEMVQFLLAQAPDYAVGDTYTSLLQCAVHGGSAELVEYLLQFAGEDFDINETMRQGGTLLKMAVSNDRPAVAAVLLAHGATFSSDGSSDVSSTRSLEMARVLSASGAVFSGDAGRDALLKAVCQDDKPLAKFLLEQGADVRESPSRSVSCLHEASLQGKYEIIELFVQHGVDINLRREHQRTPLFKAAIGGSADTVEALLRAGADPDARDEEGTSAMFVAANAGVRDVLRRSKRQH